MASHPSAVHLASILPECDVECESEYISLCDIVVTGVETPWSHFHVSNYKPESDGILEPWATLWPLKDSGVEQPEGTALWASTMRKAVEAYLNNRISHGMSITEAAKMVDGSYTDAEVADSILQFAVYGEEIYG